MASSKCGFSYRFSLQKDGYFSEDAGCHPCPRRYDSDFPWSSPPENLQRKFWKDKKILKEKKKETTSPEGFQGFCQRKIHFPPWSGPSGGNAIDAEIDATDIVALPFKVRTAWRCRWAGRAPPLSATEGLGSRRCHNLGRSVVAVIFSHSKYNFCLYFWYTFAP